MRKVLEVIWGAWEQKYLSENQKDSTAMSTSRPTGKSLDASERLSHSIDDLFEVTGHSLCGGEGFANSREIIIVKNNRVFCSTRDIKLTPQVLAVESIPTCPIEIKKLGGARSVAPKVF